MEMIWILRFDSKFVVLFFSLVLGSVNLVLSYLFSCALRSVIVLWGALSGTLPKNSHLKTKGCSHGLP